MLRRLIVRPPRPHLRRHPAVEYGDFCGASSLCPEVIGASMTSRSFVLGLLIVQLGSGSAAAQAGSRSGAGRSAAAGAGAAPPAEEEQPPVYTEAVVVSASRLSSRSSTRRRRCLSSPRTRYREHARQQLRRIAAIGAGHESHPDLGPRLQPEHARHSTLSTSQLAVLDGRSLYLDFFGFIAWDLVPVNASS